MSRCQGQGHVSSVGSSNNTSSVGVNSRVLLQAFETLNVVENVFSAPVLVYPLHVTHAVSGASSNVGNKDRKPVESQVLDEQHRELSKIWPLLTMSTPMNVHNQWPRPRVPTF